MSNTKKIALIFDNSTPPSSDFFGIAYQISEAALIDETLKHQNFDVFDKDITMEWIEDPRNFKKYSKENNPNNTAYIFASRAHEAEVIVHVKRVLDKETSEVTLTLSDIKKGPTEQQTLSNIMQTSGLRATEILMVVGGYRGGALTSRYLN